MQTFIVFQLAEQSFAISIDHIREIVLTPEITPLPLAPAYYCGVANVRGKVLAIMDLAIRFGMQGRQEILPEQNKQEALLKRTFTLVVAHPTHAIGFRVEEMPYTLNAADEVIENAPNFAQDALMQYCQALIKHETGLIVLLDLPKLLRDES